MLGCKICLKLEFGAGNFSSKKKNDERGGGFQPLGTFANVVMWFKVWLIFDNNLVNFSAYLLKMDFSKNCEPKKKDQDQKSQLVKYFIEKQTFVVNCAARAHTNYS